MKQERIKSYFHEYRWIIAASVFFILWKFLLVGIMWEGRSIAPEPDDSFEYIGQIASVSECTSTLFCTYPGVTITDHSGFSYLSYRVFFGLIGRISGYTPDTIFHFGFYLGTLVLPLVLLSFVRSFTADKGLVAWTILFLAFYHGIGETHGFYWVVPSFLAVLLFFILFAYIARTKYLPDWGAALLAIAYAFSHPMSIYLTAIFPLTIIISFFLSKSWDWYRCRRMFLVVSIIILSATVQSIYLNRLSQTNYYGVGESLNRAKFSVRDIVIGSNSKENTLSGYQLTTTQYANLLQERIDAMNISYFRYILPHWIAFFPLIFVLLILYTKKYFELFSLYISALIFFIAATLLNEYGFRSAIILWPLTFVIYAFGAWHFILSMKHITSPGIRRLFYMTFSLSIFVFFSVNAILAVTYNSNLNLRHNYFIDSTFATYLEEHLAPNEKVGMGNILVRTTGGAHLFFSQRVSSLSTRPQYVAIIDESAVQVDYQSHTKLRSLARWITDRIGIFTNSRLEAAPVHPPENYSLEKEFGVVKIYHRNS